MEQHKILLDLALAADPDADRELGHSQLKTISDSELEGCRILVVLQHIESTAFDGGAGGTVQLTCTFQPTYGTRFSYAQFWLKLEAPEGVYFLDVAPKLVNDPNPVEFTFDTKGSITLKPPAAMIEPSLESGTSKKYTRYHCLVQGSGSGTTLARWDFRENPDRKDGIGLEQVLTFTLPIRGKIEGMAMASARISRSGVKGAFDAFRDLILGSELEDRAYPVRFEIP